MEIIGPALGGIKSGCFGIENAGGRLDNVVMSDGTVLRRLLTFRNLNAEHVVCVLCLFRANLIAMDYDGDNDSDCDEDVMLMRRRHRPR